MVRPEGHWEDEVKRLAKELQPRCPDPNKDGLVWRDISDQIELKDGKANPFGWSQYRMEWNGETLGWLESGSPSITAENIQMAEFVDPSDKLKHVFFFKGMSQDDWEAVEFVKAQKK